MPDESRDSQLHTNMTSLKATHTAHRIASEIHSTATPKLQKIRQRSLARFTPRRSPDDSESLDVPARMRPCLNAKEERLGLGIAVIGTALLIVILACNLFK